MDQRLTNESIDKVEMPSITVGLQNRLDTYASNAGGEEGLQRDTQMSRESYKRPVQIKEFINPISFKQSVPFYSGTNLNFSPIIPNSRAAPSNLPTLKKASSVLPTQRQSNGL